MPIEQSIKFLTWMWDALSFGVAGFLICRARRRGDSLWGGYRAGFLGLSIAAIFVIHATSMIFGPGIWLGVVEQAIECAVPALVVNLFYHEERPGSRAQALVRLGLMLTSLTSLCGFTMTVALPFLEDGQFIDDRLNHRIQALGFVIAAATVAIVISKAGPYGEDLGKRNFYRWLAPLFALVAVLHWITAVSDSPALDVFQDLLPSVLLFLLAYYLQPRIFDVLTKEVGFYFFVLALVFVVWWILPRFMPSRSAMPVIILSVWPVISAAPWFHRRWVRWLDKVLFGRVMTPTDARTTFLFGLEGAVTEDELACAAERILEKIFGAPARISMESARNSVGAPGMCAEIRRASEAIGSISVASRRRHMQFMGEDIALLESLAVEFSILLENLRLREARLEQERKEKDLQILATRSELKALRAQINPHFLFNSLSAIAGLVSKDPQRARETVEQLAEVFRYSLYRSEKEWVRLAEEVEFVTAYLDVERARFGARLQVEIGIADAARQLFVPAMVLQVLVENAIKHGVSSVRGVGIVRITGDFRGSRLRLEVRDNGSGPVLGSKMPDRSKSGVGLRNVQERLNLYFHGDCLLTLGREAAMTVATLEMPAQFAVEPYENPQC